MSVSYDLVIAGGDVVLFDPDRILKNQNIGIRGSRIEVITGEPLHAHTTISAKGLIVSPGFIDFHSHVNGRLFSAERVLLQGGTTTIGGERSLDGEAIRKISEKGFLINQGFYISQSFTLRRAVGIKDPYRAATKKEIDQMLVLAEQFFNNGVFGIHFGLEFVPGTSEDEIVRLAELAKQYNRIVLIHLRKDGYESIRHFDEVTRIAQKTNASIHILHLMYMAGFRNTMETILKKIREARNNGFDITADTGLYSAFPTCLGASILDSNWNEDYGADASVQKLLISSGIYAGEYCDEQRFNYLRSEFPNTLVTAFVLDENQIPKALAAPFVYVSTNAADGPHYENVGHPETAGTFPRLLRKYVREDGLITLLDALRKITCEPADRFGIEHKGRIQPQNDADLVIFDPAKIQDCADYIDVGNPNAPPYGIRYVIVNGDVVVENNSISPSARFSGKMLYNTGQ